jgi:hypothetical protein
MTRAIFFLLAFFPAGFSLADGRSCNAESISDVDDCLNSVADTHEFYGLSAYYNSISYYIVEKDNLKRIEEGEVVELDEAQWLAAVGRFNVALIQAEGLAARVENLRLVIVNPESFDDSGVSILSVTKPALSSISTELDQIRYVHLWKPLAWLAKLTESALGAIQANIVNNWGLAIIFFSVCLKLLLLPVGIMTVRFQRRVSQVQAKLAPRLTQIKANYYGE